MTVRELRTDFEKDLVKRGVDAEVGITEDEEDGRVLLTVECFDMTSQVRRKILQTSDGYGLKLFYDAETILYFKVPSYYDDALEALDNAGLFYDGFEN